MFQLPREPRRNHLINILEVNDPQLSITFHLMPRISPLNPHLESPLGGGGGLSPAAAPLGGPMFPGPDGVPVSPMDAQRDLALRALNDAKELRATEGFLLKNMEKGCEY